MYLWGGCPAVVAPDAFFFAKHFCPKFVRSQLLVRTAPMGQAPEGFCCTPRRMVETAIMPVPPPLTETFLLLPLGDGDASWRMTWDIG